MIFHVNGLPADHSHEISSLIWFLQAGISFENCRLLQYFGSILRVDIIWLLKLRR